jgi:hypothetical protein
VSLSTCLFQTIQRLLQTPYSIRTIFKYGWLLDIYCYVQFSVQERGRYINVTYHKGVLCRMHKQHTQSGMLSCRCPYFVFEVVDSFALTVSTTNISALISFNMALGISPDLTNDFSFHDITTLWSADKLIHSMLSQRGQLTLERFNPACRVRSTQILLAGGVF